MAEEKLVEEKKVNIIDKILSFVFIIAIGAGMVIERLGVPIEVVFGLYGFGAMGMFFIFPLIEYIRNTKTGEGEKHPYALLMLILRGIYTVAVVYTVYKMIFTFPVIMDRNYWMYEAVIIIFILLILIGTIKGIIITIRQIRAKEDEGYTRLISGFVFMMLLIAQFSLSYERITYKNVIDLSSIKKPYGIVATNRDSEEIMIRDDEVINRLYMELTKVKTKNIRWIDDINYSLWTDRNKPMFVVSPRYKTADNKEETSHSIAQGHIYRIDVYKEGAVLKLFEDTAEGFVVGKYHIKLSKELMDRILEIIN